MLFAVCGCSFLLVLPGADTTLIDFIVTIPFSFVAERWGVKIVLLCNLMPRIFMSAWAMLVGMYYHYPF